MNYPNLISSVTKRRLFYVVRVVICGISIYTFIQCNTWYNIKGFTILNSCKKKTKNGTTQLRIVGGLENPQSVTKIDYGLRFNF